MSKEALIFEGNQKNFDQYVLLNSHKIIVVVEFMNVWSGPCSSMDFILSSLAKEFAEQFIFVKVDADEQPELCKAYKITNTPTLVVFKDGKLVRTEEGELKEKEIRSLLQDLGLYHESDLMRKQAREQHMSGNTASAINTLTNAMKADPSNTRVAMDMVQIFIDIGEFNQATSLFERLPVATRETEMGKALNGQLTFATLASQSEDTDTLKNKLAENENNSAIRFDLAVSLIAEYQFNEAANHLFYILKNDAQYKEGAAKELIVTMTNMIEPVDNALAQDIRRQFANLLTE